MYITVWPNLCLLVSENLHMIFGAKICSKIYSGAPVVLFYWESPDGEKDSANRAQSSLLELLRCSLSYLNLSESIQNQTESWRTPDGILYFGVALRARNYWISFYFFSPWQCSSELALLIWLNEKVQKLNSKLIALRAEIRSYAYGTLILGVALRARNLSKSVQNQTESGRSPGGTSLYLGTLRVEIMQNLFQN